MPGGWGECGPGSIQIQRREEREDGRNEAAHEGAGDEVGGKVEDGGSAGWEQREYKYIAGGEIVVRCLVKLQGEALEGRERHTSQFHDIGDDGRCKFQGGEPVSATTDVFNLYVHTLSM